MADAFCPARQVGTGHVAKPPRGWFAFALQTVVDCAGQIKSRGKIEGRNMPRKVVDARADAKGNISHVRIEGNERFTPLETAMNMADRGELSNVHSVWPASAKPHLRSNPDGRDANNLDRMAGDK